MTQPFDLFAEPRPLTGNTAKVRVLHDLAERVAQRPGLRILDIGVIGPAPLDFWRPLLQRYPVQLTGIDVAGIERGEAVVEQEGWQDRVTLREGSGYQLGELFKPQSFDVVVATQVLEHVARLDHFMQQVTAVLVHGGEALFTLDSAHWMSRYPWRSPRRLGENIAKKALAVAGNERHYDLPWLDSEITEACRRAGLEVQRVNYYNAESLKEMHNAGSDAGARNEVLRHWFALEEALNQQPAVREKWRDRFRVLYVRAKKN